MKKNMMIDAFFIVLLTPMYILREMVIAVCQMINVFTFWTNNNV